MIAITDSIKMAATSPGIIVFTVLSDGLNSTRTRASIPGPDGARPCSVIRSAFSRATIWAA